MLKGHILTLVNKYNRIKIKTFKEFITAHSLFREIDIEILNFFSRVFASYKHIDIVCSVHINTLFIKWCRKCIQEKLVFYFNFINPPPLPFTHNSRCSLDFMYEIFHVIDPSFKEKRV